MKFAYLFMADAVNVTEDGKINVLGGGLRTVKVSALPATVSLAILGSVESTIEEAGAYRFRLDLRHPEQGWQTFLDDAQIRIEAQDDVPADLPRGLGIQVAMQARFDVAGVYRVRARFDRARAEYVFRVILKPDQDVAGAAGG